MNLPIGHFAKAIQFVYIISEQTKWFRNLNILLQMN